MSIYSFLLCWITSIFPSLFIRNNNVHSIGCWLAAYCELVIKFHFKDISYFSPIRAKSRHIHLCSVLVDDSVISIAFNCYLVIQRLLPCSGRNSPSYESPKYLDCSSFVGQCYWRSGVAAKEGQSAADWATPSISSTFTEISESQLIPGDVGQKHWPGNAGGEDHVGIYIGTVNGTKYWLHCTGGYTDGIYHAPGKAIKINNYSGFAHFGRYPGL